MAATPLASMFNLASTPSASKTPPGLTRHALITVSVVASNPAYRTALAQALSRFPGVVVFDKCSSAREALQALAERPPRVLFASDDLPDAEGWDFIEQARALRLSTQIIGLSDREDIADVQTAFRAGAMGYLLRTAPIAALHQALHDVTTGGAPLSPSVARALVASYSAPPSESGLLADLTSRESEVLDMLSRGLRYRQIATMMRLSPDTVHSHAKKVYRKLGVRSKTEAAMIWMRSLGDVGGSSKLLSVPLSAVA